jgi:hypothetical protein
MFQKTRRTRRNATTASRSTWLQTLTSTFRVMMLGEHMLLAFLTRHGESSCLSCPYAKTARFVMSLTLWSRCMQWDFSHLEVTIHKFVHVTSLPNLTAISASIYKIPRQSVSSFISCLDTAQSRLTRSTRKALILAIYAMDAIAEVCWGSSTNSVLPL